MVNVSFQNGPLLCGGSEDINCIKITEDGHWQTTNSLQKERYHHSSWSIGEDVLLLGGAIKPDTTELVLSNGTSIPHPHIFLKYPVAAACLIDEGERFVLTGGSLSHRNVIRSIIQSFIIKPKIKYATNT